MINSTLLKSKKNIKFVTIQQNTNSSVYKMKTIQTNNPKFLLCNHTKKKNDLNFKSRICLNNGHGGEIIRKPQ